MSREPLLNLQAFRRWRLSSPKHTKATWWKRYRQATIRFPRFKKILTNLLLTLRFYKHYLGVFAFIANVSVRSCDMLVPTGYFVMQIFDRLFGLQYVICVWCKFKKLTRLEKNMIDSKGASLIPSYMDSSRKILVIPGIVIILTFWYSLPYWFVLSSVVLITSSSVCGSLCIMLESTDISEA